MSDATSINSARDRRWLILGVIGLAQLMVVLDLTVMNIALPSAQRALGFTTVDRQWVVTAYTLAFGSLLLLGGRLADLLGPQGHVPDRPGRVRRGLGHRRRLGQLRHADHRAGLPGRVRGAAGAVGAVVGGALLRRGPLGQKRTPPPAQGGVTTAQAEASRERAQ